MKAQIIITVTSKTEEGTQEIKKMQQEILCGVWQRDTDNVKLKATFQKIED